MRGGTSLASILLAAGVGIALLAAMVAWNSLESSDLTSSKVAFGTGDEVYYSHAATKQDAQVLGQALKGVGYFSGRGNSVFLSKGRGGTVVSFVVRKGLWDLPDTASDFEEVGRRVAAAVGGFPIEVRLIDSARTVRREMTVGKVMMGARDEIYYFGSATKADAEALGRALQAAGFLRDTGASVELAKGAGSAISFVVSEDAWKRPEVVASFESVARSAAAAAGGLPIKLRLLSPQMETKLEVAVQ